MIEREKTWTLDPRLEKDSILICSRDTWQIRLVDDRRWPWIILVPVVNDAVDLEDLELPLIAPLIQEAASVSQTLKMLQNAGKEQTVKTNVATIGNIVSQFHLHIVGRRPGDPNWPNPVWGYGERQRYSLQEAKRFITGYKAAWQRTAFFLNQ